MNQMANLPSCLDHYRRYQQQRAEQIDEGINDYCLLTSVLSANDEVRLHSRFIYSMINPAGLHYKKHEFLKLFLEASQYTFWKDFDYQQAVVEREKGNIDLLIHDGYHYIIVENKLNADDQRHQITRYIKYVQETYLPGNAELTKRIGIIYLSKSRLKPSEKSQSLVGFKLEDQRIEWQGLPEEKKYQSLKKIRLAQGESLPFIHMGYSPGIESWVKACLKIAPKGVDSALNDYLLVLKRLQKQSLWRNVMTLDQYAMSLDDNAQKEMYEFMVEANNRLVDFVAVKLYEELSRLFGGELVAPNEKYKAITPETLKNWLNRTPKKKNKQVHVWRDLACCTTDPTKPQRGLLLAVDYAYFSELDEEGKIRISKDDTVVRYGEVRKVLTRPDGIYKFIDCIKGLLDQ